MSALFQELITKLDSFIRKYHTNQLLKGLLLFIAGFGGLFVVVTLIEYFGYLSSFYRALLFFGFIGFNLFVFIRFVIIPIAGIIKIGKRISFEQAAIILGKHFKNEVGDKILNTLQLKEIADKESFNSDLLIAGIEQKSKNLNPIPFGKAIDFKINLRYLPYAFMGLFVFGGGLMVFPYIFKESAGRIIRFEQQFERPAPFTILFEDPLLSAVRNERYKMVVFTEGTVLPAEMEIVFSNSRHRMRQDGRNSFFHEFRSVNQPVDFYLHAGGFNFGPFLLNVQSRASFKTINLELVFPAHTGMEKEIVHNVGDIEIPEGTLVTWNISTNDTDSVLFFLPADILNAEVVRPEVFSMQQRVTSAFDYSMVAYHEKGGRGDSLNYRVRVIPDRYPVISVQEFQDSVMLAHLFFEGLIRDDYGFSDLSFFYLKTNQEITADEFNANDFVREPIVFDPNNLNQIFFFHLDLNAIQIKPGEFLYYFFQVTDNDRINQPKATRTRLFNFRIPGLNELMRENVSRDEEVSSGLNQSRQEVSQIQNEIDRLRRSMLESNTITWEQQENLKQLLERQQQAQDKFEQLQQMAEENRQRDQQFRSTDENILKKQEELQRLFDEVLTDELKELYDKIQQELQNLDRQKVFDMLERLQFELSDYENRLDRALELFKQLQVERMLSESISAVKELQNRQDQLYQDNLDGKESSELKNQQDQLKNDLLELQDFVDDMLKKNEELSRPNNMEDVIPDMERIKDLMNQASEQLQRNQRARSGQSQQNSSQSLQNLQQKLQDMLNNMQQQNLAEDIRTLREILDNLIKTSFAQEELMQSVREMNVRDPKFPGLIQQQRKISNDLKMIQDSLVALSKRQIQIQSFVSREIAEINMNIDNAIDHLINRRKHTATSRQQFVMTHVNNLALLLNESMQNMQMQMQMQGQGEGQNSQAGEGSPGFPDLRQMQQQMNEMLEQLQQGQQPMPGQTGEQGMGMSEQLARMAAEQEAIRHRLNKLADDIRREGSGTGDLDQIIRDMERTELDIVTRNVTRQTILRQQRILTRLLEHERAQLEREQEERRVGETAKTLDLSNPKDFFEYNRIKNQGIEMLRSMPPGFNPWYRSLVENYFLNVE